MDYKKSYHFLFNAVTDALNKIDEKNIYLAADILRKAQQKTEEDYISSNDDKDE